MIVTHVHKIAGIGGSERHLLTLLPALAERGVDARFVGLDTDEADPFYEQLGVPYVRLSSPRRLRRALRGADIVHTHLVHADVFGALVAGSTPLVSTKHNDDPFRVGPYRFVERTITRRARRVIAITESLKRFCVERVGLPEAKLHVIRYGLNEPPRAWGANPPLELGDGPVVAAVARLAPQKGVDVAIRALPAIRREHPDAVLAVLGEGPERAALEELARSLGVAAAVALPGRVGDMAALYRRAELVVHPVRWEGFGLALLEAMLAERPVVASAVSAAPEIVEAGRTGLLVPPDDAGAFAAAVSSLLADRARAAELGRAGLERARAEFSVARMADRTLDAYRRALS